MLCFRMAKIALCVVFAFFLTFVHCEQHWALLVAGSNGYYNYRHQITMTNLIHWLVLLIFLTLVNGEKHWALLVAGSNGYYNYRHQADICHAYHIIRNHGIPNERIVVMMYDDIAYNEENPVQGNIINHPNGPNLYPGVPKDYRADEVSPEVFLKVLTGDAEGVKKLLGREGKVIASGPDDRIFVNFADHGAPGILAFPNDVLQAEDLHTAISKMHAEKRYKQMVFYIEACESGSMFDNILESNINVYATTAANSDESSYACYEDTQRGTYLGDVYSVNWMEDSDRERLNTETLEYQFELVKNETNTSHVMLYGDTKLGKLILGDFQGNQTGRNSLRFLSHLNNLNKIHPSWDAVPSEEVRMRSLIRKVSNSNGIKQEKYRSDLEALIKQKQETEEFFRNVVDDVTGVKYFDFFLKSHVQFSSFKCYRKSVSLIQMLCPGMKLTQNDYALRKLRVLANMCEVHKAEDIWTAVAKVSFISEICGSS